MLSQKEKERYNRHLILQGFGEEAQEKLKAAKVLVVGAGGLGCPALLYLAAAGIGTIGIVDYDIVCISNLQRQILFTENDLGKNKADTAKQKLLQQNSHINIQSIPEKITRENVTDLIQNFDVVIDGTDNFPTRYLLNDACVILNKPLVYGALYRFEGQVAVFNYKNGPTYRCLFPEPPAEDEMPSCNEAGVIGVLPGIIGTWQATETIKILTGKGEPLSGKLLRIDLLTNATNTFEFESETKNQKIISLGNYDFDNSCVAGSIALNAFIELQKKQTVQLIDVREKNEYSEKNLQGINIPLAELEERIYEINPSLKTVIHCKTGVRSLKAIATIRKHFPQIEIYNLVNPF